MSKNIKIEHDIEFEKNNIPVEAVKFNIYGWKPDGKIARNKDMYNAVEAYRDALDVLQNGAKKVRIKAYNVNGKEIGVIYRMTVNDNKENILKDDIFMPKITPKPKPKKNTVSSESYIRDPKEIEKVLQMSGYKCEIGLMLSQKCGDKNILKQHESFSKDKNGTPYMEVHHLIPFHHQDVFESSIDLVENLICLCPTCHRKLHFMELNDRKKLLTFIYKKRDLQNKLALRGIPNITLEKFIKLACD